MCFKKGAHDVCCCCFMHHHHVWTGWPQESWNNPASHSHDTGLCQIQIKLVNGTDYSCQQTQDTYWAHELYWRTQLPSKLPMKTWRYRSLHSLNLLQSREVVVKYGEFVPAGICHAFLFVTWGQCAVPKKQNLHYTALILFYLFCEMLCITFHFNHRVVVVVPHWTVITIRCPIIALSCSWGRGCNQRDKGLKSSFSRWYCIPYKKIPFSKVFTITMLMSITAHDHSAKDKSSDE